MESGMSYASTMQFLNTGMASGGGTEDPRYAGFSGGCGSTARSCGAPIAGQTRRFGYQPSWRLTPGAYHDYSSTFRVPGAPPSPGESRVAHTAAIAGAHDDCVSTCAALCEAMHEHPAPLVPPAPQAKPAVVRPMWERGHMAHFSSIAGKSRADAIRLARRPKRAAVPPRTVQGCPEGYLQMYCKKWDYGNKICLELGSRCTAPYR